MGKRENNTVKEPDFEEAKSTAISLRMERVKLLRSRPDCKILKKKYSEVFQSYKTKIRELDRKRKDVLKEFDYILKLEYYLVWTKNNLQKSESEFRKFRKNQDRFRNTRGRMNFKKFERALDIFYRRYVEDLSTRKEFSKDQLKEAKALKEELVKLGPTPRKLRESTHEWEPCGLLEVIIKPGRLKNAGMSLEARSPETRIIMTRRKCVRCQREEPVRNEI